MRERGSDGRRAARAVRPVGRSKDQDGMTALHG